MVDTINIQDLVSGTWSIWKAGFAIKREVADQ